MIENNIIPISIGLLIGGIILGFILYKIIVEIIKIKQEQDAILERN